MHSSFTINGEWNKTKKKRAQGKQKKKKLFKKVDFRSSNKIC